MGRLRINASKCKYQETNMHLEEQFIKRLNNDATHSDKQYHHNTKQWSIIMGQDCWGLKIINNNVWKFKRHKDFDAMNACKNQTRPLQPTETQNTSSEQRYYNNQLWQCTQTPTSRYKIADIVVQNIYPNSAQNIGRLRGVQQGEPFQAGMQKHRSTRQTHPRYQMKNCTWSLPRYRIEYVNRHSEYHIT